MKKTLCTFNDFLKLDVRSGEVVEASNLEHSTKLLQLQVDLGPDYGSVTILSGIAKFIKPADLIGKKVPVVANLEPKTMAGSVSNGFILMADLTDHSPCLIFIDPSVPNGTVIC